MAKIDVQVAELKSDVKYVIKLLENPDTGLIRKVNDNTEFRLKATGVMAVVGVIGGFIGSLAVWIVGRVWK